MLNLKKTTLLASILLILSLSSALAEQNVRPNHRIIKKRALAGIVGAAADPATVKPSDGSSVSVSGSGSSVPATSSSAPATSSSAPVSKSSSASASASASSASASVSASASASVSASKSSSASVSASASASSSSSSSSESSSSSSSSTPTSASEASQVTPEPEVITSDGVVTTITRTAPIAQQSDVAANTQSGASNSNNKMKTAAITTIIVIASSIGAVVLIWTIFRKWKLARSKRFDNRLNPVDFAPTGDDGIPGSHRRYSASSSRSGVTGYGASDHGHRGLPEHDFTAGAHLAPVGGYADLARRSPSPQPMQQVNYGGYGAQPSYPRY